MQNEADAFRKVRLRVEDVQGKNCLTNFWVCVLVSVAFAPSTLSVCVQSILAQAALKFYICLQHWDTMLL